MPRPPRGYKRVVTIGDLHSGHVTGLTHPDFRVVYPNRDEVQYDLMCIRDGIWDFYAETLDALRPIHVLIVNGDAIEGKGDKSGSTEILNTDRAHQADMAAAAILYAKPKFVFMSYGTPYHTGASEDWEDLVAERVGAVKIGGHDWVGIMPGGDIEKSYDGLVFDYRHFVSRSVIPHGRHTSIARERLWNLLWAEHGEYPKADVILRSHVHYLAGAFGSNWRAIALPALQAKTKFGTRIATGTVDLGIVWFDVKDKHNYSMDWRLYKPRTAHKEVVWV